VLDFNCYPLRKAILQLLPIKDWHDMRFKETLCPAIPLMVLRAWHERNRSVIMEEYLQVYVEAVSKMPLALSVVPKARSRRVEFLPQQGCFDVVSLNMNGFWFLRPLLDIFLSQAISERGMQYPAPAMVF